MSEEREVEKVGGGNDEFEAHKLTTDKVGDEPTEIEKVTSDRSDSDGPSDDDFEGHKLTTTETVVEKVTDL